jgi:hypothetical protein
MDCLGSQQPACRSPIRGAVANVGRPSQAVDSALRAARLTALVCCIFWGSCQHFGEDNSSDVIATILKVKHLAAEVGGLKKLKTLVEALGE